MKHVKFRIELIESGEEEIVARVKSPSELTEKIEQLISFSGKRDSVIAYSDDEFLELKFSDIECFFVLERKLYASVIDGKRYRIKGKLCDIEENIPKDFVRINKSAIANIKRILKFVKMYVPHTTI